MVELIVVAVIAIAVFLLFGKKKPVPHEVATPDPEAGKDIVDLNVVPEPMPGKIEAELAKWPFPPPPEPVQAPAELAPVVEPAPVAEPAPVKPTVRKPAAKKAPAKKTTAKKAAPKKAQNPGRGHQLTVQKPPVPKKRPAR
jgi:hypothetical protein